MSAARPGVGSRAWWLRGGVVAGLLGAAVAGRRRIRELERRARELGSLTDRAPDVVIRFDRALRIRYVNPLVETYTGVPPAAMLGRTVAELGFPEADVRAWEAGLHAVLATGERNVIEFTFSTPAGPRHFESRVVPEFARDGTIQSLLGITRDVTDRRVAEERFRRNEAFLAAGQRISHTGSWSRNCETGAVIWSDEQYRIFGADPAVPRPWTTEALRALFWARVHEADRASVQRTFERAMRDFTPVSLEYRIVLPDGSVRHIQTDGRRGDGDEYIGTTVDVTATRTVEEQRRRSEAYLAEGQRLTRTGSWGWNLVTNEIFWSRETFRIYGFEPADRAPPYETVLARAHPDDAPGVDRSLKEAFQTGADVRLLTRILVPGERMKWVQTHGHAVRDDGGRVVELVGTVVDVTSRVRANRRLRRAIKARYAAVLAERTRIARDMHDGLLQDVTGIALQLAAMLPHVDAAPEVAARLLGVLRLAEQAGREARMAVQGMREQGESVDLVSAVHHVAQRALAPSVLTLTVRVSGRPRSVAASLCGALAAVVQEAVANALAHADARAVTVAVAFTARRVRLTVRDDGRGLRPRSDADAGREHFGLVGMRERAAAIGAAFAVSSAPGRGTAIRLDVPCRA